MKPQLNHLIVWATDRRAPAEQFADVADIGPPTEYGHFTRVETGNGIMLDFADTNGDLDCGARDTDRHPSQTAEQAVRVVRAVL